MAKNPLSCGAQCSRITLITLNVIFLLLGIALLILGLVFRFGGSELKEDIEPTFKDISINDYDLYSLLNSLAIIFIVVGAVVILFSFLGFVGAVCLVRAALVIYAILIGICLALELAGVILFFVLRSEMTKAVRLGMKESIEKANEGKDDYLKATQYMFKTFECCHVDNEHLPASNLGEATSTCLTTGNKYSVDCYDAFTDWLESYQIAFVVVGICGMVIQLLLIVFACWVCRSSRKEELV
ncbi:tetraspanin-7-like [Mercenaria mercenaria]|uniref:tetraspanin-7-like n=1 Tax=Mercenaria mercenaria TaxID=6596 RepID=UPI00234EFB31|nr:tetraspanin-7-like [Mercenaria mercenaria]